jgi:hypothetical protein
MTLILASTVSQGNAQTPRMDVHGGGQRARIALGSTRGGVPTAQQQVRIQTQMPHDDLHTPLLRHYSLRPLFKLQRIMHHRACCCGLLRRRPIS